MLNNKIKDGIVGLAIGDALGVPAEFKTREELKQNPITEMIGDGTYNVPEGTWSDDTSMALATLDSIASNKDIDTDDMADRFLKWFRENEYTGTGNTFDIGRTTLQALAKYECKIAKAEECGEKSEYSNGNGSLMRILPIAYYIFDKKITDDSEIYNIVKKVSSITHAHELSIMACYIYVRFVIELLNKKDKIEAYNSIKKLNYNMFQNKTIEQYDRILKNYIYELKEDNISSSGYVVSTLEASLWLFLNSNDYNETILKAVNLGDDTDTVAACTGGLLGIYYGIDNIREEWIYTLKNINLIYELCDKYNKVRNEK